MDLLPSRNYYPRALVVFKVVLQSGLVVPFQAVPRSVDVKRNTARKADEATIELDYVDLPIDPRIVQSMHVAVHIENAIDPLIPMFPSRLNLRFVGNVDEPQVMLSESSDVLRLTARDYTAILIAKHWTECVAVPVPGVGTASAVTGKAIPTPPGLTLYAIVEAIRLLLMPLAVPVGFFEPAVAEAAPNLVTNRTFWTPPDKNATAWDAICGLCDLFGFLPSFDLDVLTIRTASGSGFGFATMVYGQNVSKLVFKRNLTRAKPHAVRVTAYNQVIGIPMTATWGEAGPLGSPPSTSVSTGLPSAELAKVHEHHLPAGNYTPDKLALIAQSIYEEGVKGRLEGEIETRDLTDITMVNSLLGLKNGDRLTMMIGPEAVTSLSGKTAAESIAYLANPLRPGALPVPVATLLVQAWTTANSLSVLFYVTEAAHKWSRDDGYTLTVRFSDFVLGV